MASCIEQAIRETIRQIRAEQALARVHFDEITKRLDRVAGAVDAIQRLAEANAGRVKLHQDRVKNLDMRVARIELRLAMTPTGAGAGSLTTTGRACAPQLGGIGALPGRCEEVAGHERHDREPGQAGEQAVHGPKVDVVLGCVRCDPRQKVMAPRQT